MKKQTLRAAILAVVAGTSLSIMNVSAADTLTFDGNQFKLNGNVYTEGVPADLKGVSINSYKIGEGPNPFAYTSGNNNDKTVSVTGGQLAGIAAARTENASANNNHLILNGGTGLSADTSIGDEYKAVGIFTGDANNNTIDVKKFGLAPSIYGVDLDGIGAASGNTVTVDSIEHAGEVIGVYQAINENNVSTDKKLANNTVTINDGIVDYVAGAASDTYDEVTDKKGQVVENNTVTINKGTFETVVGGLTGKAEAIGNKVTINGGTVTGAEDRGLDNDDRYKYSSVMAGKTDGADANNNTVIVSGGTVQSIVAAWTENANANNNTVTINDGTVTGVEDRDNDKQYKDSSVLAAKTINADVNSNIVTVNGGTVTSIAVGRTENGNANGNKLVLNGGTGAATSPKDDHEYRAARVDDGDANNNTVEVKNFGKVSTIYGVDINGYGAAEGNTVTVDNVEAVSDVVAAYQATNYSSDELDKREVKNNSVTINGGNVAMAAGASADWFGKEGTPKTEKALNNKVTLNDGTVGGIFGASSQYNQANNNTVTVKGGAVSGVVNVKLNGDGIDGGEMDDDTFQAPGNPNFVIGGISDVAANNNTVNIESADAFKNNAVEVWGGHHITAGAAGDVKTGNTLNVNQVKDITLARLGNFETYNFDLPSNTVNGDTVLTVKDVAGTDVSNSKINVGVSGAEPALKSGDKVTLIRNEAGVNTNGVTYGKLQQGVSLSYDLKAQDGSDGKSVIALVDGGKEDEPSVTPDKPSVTPEPENPSVTPENPSVTPENPSVTPDKPSVTPDKPSVTPDQPSVTPDQPSVTPGKPAEDKPNTGAQVLPQTKSLVETRAAVAGFVNDNQSVVERALASAANSTDSTRVMAAIGNAHMRTETGSYAKTNGTHAVLGLARTIGHTEWSPYIEAGWGNYNTHLDSGVRGDGNVKYYGLGILAKSTFANGTYFESGLRAGRASYDYSSNDLVTAAGAVNTSYDADNTYYGAQIGFGRVQAIHNQYKRDLYAKLFYNHQNAADATLQGAGLGETYKFDSVDSLRARAGMRITKDLSNRNSWYAGLAYEYEFDGDASANVKGFSTETPSLGGGSGLIEAGYTYGGANDSFGTGIGLEGWVGTKRGFVINGSAHWKF